MVLLKKIDSFRRPSMGVERKEFVKTGAPPNRASEKPAMYGVSLEGAALFAVMRSPASRVENGLPQQVMSASNVRPWVYRAS